MINTIHLIAFILCGLAALVTLVPIYYSANNRWQYISSFVVFVLLSITNFIFFIL